MIPIHKLLKKIVWDREFGRAEFALKYYDRLEDRLIKIDFQEIFFEEASPFAFHLLDSDGIAHTIPLHRIKEVYRNNELIWQRRT